MSGDPNIRASQCQGMGTPMPEDPRARVPRSAAPRVPGEGARLAQDTSRHAGRVVSLFCACLAHAIPSPARRQPRRGEGHAQCRTALQLGEGGSPLRGQRGQSRVTLLSDQRNPELLFLLGALGLVAGVAVVARVAVGVAGAAHALLCRGPWRRPSPPATAAGSRPQADPESPGTQSSLRLKTNRDRK